MVGSGFVSTASNRFNTIILPRAVFDSCSQADLTAVFGNRRHLQRPRRANRRRPDKLAPQSGHIAADLISQSLPCRGYSGFHAQHGRRGCFPPGSLEALRDGSRGRRLPRLRERTIDTVSRDGLDIEDVENAEKWFLDQLRELSGKFAVRGITISAHERFRAAMGDSNDIQRHSAAAAFPLSGE